MLLRRTLVWFLTELSKMNKIIKLSRKEGIASPQTILEIRLLCFSISPCDSETKRETREIKRKSY